MDIHTMLKGEREKYMTCLLDNVYGANSKKLDEALKKLRHTGVIFLENMKIKLKKCGMEKRGRNM